MSHNHHPSGSDGFCETCRVDAIDALSGVLDADQRKRFENRLNAHPGCADAWRAMRETMDLMEHLERPEPGPAFWDGYWTRLEDRLPRADRHLVPAPVRSTATWVWQAAAAIALLVTGMLIGRYLLREVPAPVTATGSAATVQTAAVAQRTEMYLERSKVLLLGLTHIEPVESASGAFDLAPYREQSEVLLQEASYLKTVLDRPGEARLRELVGELEIILLQIANMEAASDLEAVDMIRGGVDQSAVLLKINLETLRRTRSGEGSDSRERDATDGQPATKSNI